MKTQQPRQSSFELAAAHSGDSEAFKSVKFDTADNSDYEGERWLVVVAKGDVADRIAEAYARG